MNPILGNISVFEPGVLLSKIKGVDASPYMNFESPYFVDGLVYEMHAGKTVNFLAINSKFPGNGDFRKFMIELKKTYDFILIWDILNPVFLEILHKYEFSFCRGRPWKDCPDICNGMAWKSPNYKPVRKRK